VSSSESLSPRITPLISGYGLEVPSRQTGVSAVDQDIPANLWHPSSFPDDFSVSYYYVTICLSLKSRGVLELRLGMGSRAGHRTWERREHMASSLSISLLQQKAGILLPLWCV